jgi:hypothetical protein
VIPALPPFAGPYPSEGGRLVVTVKIAMLHS